MRTRPDEYDGSHLQPQRPPDERRSGRTGSRRFSAVEVITAALLTLVAGMMVASVRIGLTAVDTDVQTDTVLGYISSRTLAAHRVYEDLVMQPDASRVTQVLEPLDEAIAVCGSMLTGDETTIGVPPSLRDDEGRRAAGTLCANLQTLRRVAGSHLTMKSGVTLTTIDRTVYSSNLDAVLSSLRVTQRAVVSAGRKTLHRLFLLTQLLLFPSFAILLTVVRRYRHRAEDRQAAADASRASAQRERDFALQIMNAMAHGLTVTSSDGRYEFVNPALARMLGFSPGEIVGRSPDEFVCDGDATRLETRVARRGPGEASSYEVRMRRADGTMVPAHVSAVHRWDDGRPTGTIAVITDLTERKQAEEALKEANARLEQSLAELEQRHSDTMLLREMVELLQACRSPEEGYQIVAQCVPRLFPDLPGALFILKSSKDFAEAVAFWGDPVLTNTLFAPDDCWAIRRGRVHAVDGQTPGTECGHVRAPVLAGSLCVPMIAAGETLGVLYLQGAGHTCGPLGAGDQRAEVRQQLAIAAAENIALALSNLRLQATLRSQSIRDPLTGLYNRRYMEESAARELHRAASEGTPMAAAMLDLDHFKRFNDTVGHAAGDALLREVATYLQRSIRFEDIGCRYGGEEFILVLQGLPPDTVIRRLEELREGVRRLDVVHLGQSLGGITVSIGVAFYPAHGRTVEALVQAADSAMYRAKAAGRNRVVVAGSVLTEERRSVPMLG